MEVGDFIAYVNLWIFGSCFVQFGLIFLALEFFGWMEKDAYGK
jgi:hypothetical protein